MQHEINTLRKVVPTAAAIAIATVQSNEVNNQQQKKDGPAIHKEVTEHPGTAGQSVSRHETGQSL